jgi:hypothetical protein
MQKVGVCGRAREVSLVFCFTKQVIFEPKNLSKFGLITLMLSSSISLLLALSFSVFVIRV